MAIFSDDSAILAYFSGLNDSSHLASPKGGRYWKRICRNAQVHADVEKGLKDYVLLDCLKYFYRLPLRHIEPVTSLHS
jgi:hypothetical protein